jgi:hypothetical protein
MFALRQIQPIDGEFITIRLPIEFKHCKRAEIIVLPVEDTVSKQNTEAFIQQFAGSITDFSDIQPLLLETRDSL